MLSEKDSLLWKPRLTRDAIKFVAKDPEPSPQKPDLKSVIEGQVTLSLDEKYTLQAVCKAVSSL